MKVVTRSLLCTLIIAVPLLAYTPRLVLTGTGTGIALERWAASSFPIVWRLNSTRGASVTGTRALDEVFRQAFATWSGVSTAVVSFSEGSATNVNAARAGWFQPELHAPAGWRHGAHAITGEVVVYGGASVTIVVTQP